MPLKRKKAAEEEFLNRLVVLESNGK